MITDLPALQKKTRIKKKDECVDDFAHVRVCVCVCSVSPMSFETLHFDPEVPLHI